MGVFRRPHRGACVYVLCGCTRLGPPCDALTPLLLPLSVSQGTQWTINVNATAMTVSAATYLGSTVEFSQCSNRGICDFKNGSCACFPNYRTFLPVLSNALPSLPYRMSFVCSPCAEGVNCHISVVNSSVPLYAVQMTYAAMSSSYTGNVLYIEEEKGPAPDYYMMYMAAATEHVRKGKGGGGGIVLLRTECSTTHVWWRHVCVSSDVLTARRRTVVRHNAECDHCRRDWLGETGRSCRVQRRRHC